MIQESIIKKTNKKIGLCKNNKKIKTKKSLKNKKNLVMLNRH